MPREAVPDNLEIPEWRTRREQLDRFLAGKNMSQVKLVFLGDSITQGWDVGLFDQYYGPRSPLNLGLWGDFTQGMLYRLRAGEWPADLRPKLVVLLLGTNNTPWNPKPEDTALGIAEVIRFIQTRSPGTKVLLLGILPRGESPSEPLRAVNAAVNKLIARCADGVNTVFMDPGRLLLEPNGRLSPQTAFDQLHLTWAGYSTLAAALEPEIKRLMGE